MVEHLKYNKNPTTVPVSEKRGDYPLLVNVVKK